LKLRFEVVGGVVAKRRMPSLGVVVGDVVADFELGFGQLPPSSSSALKRLQNDSAWALS